MIIKYNLLKIYLDEIKKIEHYRTDFTPKLKIQINQLQFCYSSCSEIVILYFNY